MKTFSAIDLHSNNGVLTVIDENDKVLKQKKLTNRLELFVNELEPFRATLQGVAIESTFNWYWLVDGLRTKDFPVVLVNTSAIQQYEGPEAHGRSVRRLVAGSHDAPGDPSDGSYLSPRGASHSRSAAETSDAHAATDGEYPECAEPRGQEPGNENLIE